MRSNSTVLPVRINRFTGTAEFYLGSWMSSSAPQDSSKLVSETPPIQRSLTQAELEKLQLDWKFAPDRQDELEVSVYNGTNCAIDSVVFEVALTPAVQRAARQQGDTDTSDHGRPPVVSESDLVGLSPEERTEFIRMFYEKQAADEREHKVVAPFEKPRKFRPSPAFTGMAGPMQISHWTIEVGTAPTYLPLLVKAVEATGTPEIVPK